ncbi:MAG: 50S ribosomal protein L4 [Candidatus Omnitrophota bacterium]
MIKAKTTAKKTKVLKTSKPEFSSAIPVFNVQGKEVEKYQLDKELFTGKINKAVLYQAVVMYNACARQGNASTKTRGDVSGGGKKPYRQKGTGQARAGSTRSPLWRHGGSIFGPHPRDYRYDIPKKLKRAALLSSINSKLADSRMIGISEVTVAEPKTKSFRGLVNALKLGGKSLFVVDDVDQNVIRASRNMQEVSVKNYRDFNTMDVLHCDNLVISRQALEKLPGRFNR